MKRKRSDSSDTKKPASKVPFWALGLLKTMKDPKYLVKKDDRISIIKDMYPKAQHHFLVLPEDDLSSLKSLTTAHLPLLKHMDETARKYVEQNHPTITFKLGYHSEASMHRLHMHLISEDMVSEALKTKKHWNSFTTEFFLDSRDVIDGLERCGSVQLPSREKCMAYMETALKCHKCSFVPKNMPDLKKHIVTHSK